MDMRAARAMIKEKCSERAKEGQKTRVLNLFCYTSSFSVAAASGGADFVQSVDLSNTYLNWSKKNFSLNGLDPEKFEWTKGDVMAFLDQAARRDDSSALYDIIILDPPTFSNSKSAANDLDIKRDWPILCRKCLAILKSNGILYFSTNAKTLKFDPSLLPPGTRAQDITEQTIDPDFKTKKSHKMWLLQNAD